jgi:hypothetical protein
LSRYALSLLSPTPCVLRHTDFTRTKYQAAITDVDQKHTAEIAAQIRKVNAADYESRADESDEQAYARAMRDPEVRHFFPLPLSSPLSLSRSLFYFLLARSSNQRWFVQ